MSVSIAGTVAPGYEPIRTVFEAAFDGVPSMGAALAILVEGELVANLWGGIADERDGRGWEHDTASVIFSCTKGLMSLLVARLVEQGRLDYGAPVARYWPEFAAAGKGAVTVSEALGHRAGLSAPREDFELADILDWDAATSKLAAQAPLWPPGEGYAYHALTHGWLAGELVRRVTGQSPGAYLRETIAPLGAEAWIGLPPSRGNVAHLQVAPELADLWVADAAKAAAGEINWPYRAMTLGRALPAALVTSDGGFNDRRVQQAEIPGAGGIATAEALATIWSAAVTETRGVRLASADVLQRATATVSEGAPVFPAEPPYARWGRGFQLDSEARRFLTVESFGHDGAGGQVAFADPRHRVGFAFITNWMRGPGDNRGTALVDTLRQLLGAS
ncbi:serine hydrolase [Devosia sp. ZB163]|uniref:serine hydrolase domain-containing protein n=1 Tax=Devosia sp. ZB163 TaxID=3025938 RepID=UPI00235F6A25|nr:serine hydrolase domain-containing protein [Devosia sp. ZB163]MDC9826225.1 serine hydrolase [Devosia sp. ZB163]